MRFEEAQFSAENDSDFLVTYSALATAFVVGNEPVPLKLSSGMDSTRPAGDTLSPVDKAGILYTDEIGEYMEVKSVKALIFSEQVFEHPIMTTTMRAMARPPIPSTAPLTAPFMERCRPAISSLPSKRRRRPGRERKRKF